MEHHSVAKNNMKIKGRRKAGILFFFFPQFGNMTGEDINCSLTPSMSRADKICENTTMLQLNLSFSEISGTSLVIQFLPYFDSPKLY